MIRHVMVWLLSRICSNQWYLNRNFIILIFSGLVIAGMTSLSHAQNLVDNHVLPQLVSDINSDTPNSQPRSLVVMNDTLYFSAGDAEHRTGLWKSDGTDEGTQLVTNLEMESDRTLIRDIATVNEKLIITAGGRIWLSDGTGQGTAIVASDELEGTYTFSKFVVVDSLVYFTGRTHTSTSLWRSDGTEAGTIKLQTFERSNAGNGINYALYLQDGDQLSGKLYFFVTKYEQAVSSIASSVIWESDGTKAGTLPKITINATESGWAITSGIDAFYFVTFDVDTNSANIWRSDGTQQNTALVKTITPHFSLISTSWEDIVWNDVFYVAIRQTDDDRGEFWKSDGTADGTVKIGDICARKLFPYSGSLFFAGNDCNGTYIPDSLWTTDGSTLGTGELSSVEVSDSSWFYPHHFVEMDGHLYFSGATSIGDSGLWRTDGTENGTELVRELNLSSSIDSRRTEHELHISENDLHGRTRNVVLSGNLYFAANDRSVGIELYRSNGTEAGTQIVKDIHGSQTFSSLPQQMTAFQNRLCLSAGPTWGRGLYCSDGDLRLYQQVLELSYEGVGSTSTSIDSIVATDDSLYLVVGEKLWKIDDTASGAHEITPDIAEYDGGGLLLMPLKDKLLFHNSRGYRHLWSTNGTNEGVQPLRSFRNIHQFTLFDDSIFFEGEYPASHGLSYEFGLWKSDGSVEGTVEVIPGRIDVIASGDTTLYILAYGGQFDTDRELFISDGTSEGTTKLRDIQMPTPYSQSNKNWLIVNDTFYFVATDDVHGRELWKSDGTSQGTGIAVDLLPGPDSSYPLLLATSDSQIYFTTLNQSDDSAWDLWTSDGTTEGTMLVSQFSNVVSPYYVHDDGVSVATGRINAEYWNGHLLLMLQRPSGEIDSDGNTIYHNELWASRGTADSTTLLMITDPVGCRDGFYSIPCPLMKHTQLNQIFFTAFDDVHGYELWTLSENSAEPTSTPLPTVTQAPTNLPTPTNTEVPTDPAGPVATATTGPTSTKTPLATPTPTSTFTPTSTPSPTDVLLLEVTLAPTQTPTQTKAPVVIQQPTERPRATATPFVVDSSPTATATPSVTSAPLPLEGSTQGNNRDVFLPLVR